MEQEISFLEKMAANGGPSKEDYDQLNLVIRKLADCKKNCDFEKMRKNLVQTLGESFSTQTMQGFAYSKPHGYPGDFEIIERIYDKYTSKRKDLEKWDIYWQSHPAANAVRNRKDYFQSLLTSTEQKNTHAKVLNVASGPARDLVEFLLSGQGRRMEFHCIDQDVNAIEFANRRCAAYEHQVSFTKANAFRFETSERYNLIWSAGLFDYFDDSTFVKMIRKLANFLTPGGQLVIGNFCDSNPSRPYMELFEWILHHRSPEKMTDLARKAGVQADKISILSESENVNLFMHIQS